MKTNIRNKIALKGNKRLDKKNAQIKLLMAASRALKLSYSPYSLFRVGAAVLKENGKIYLGANIENASYPLCLCAERSALAHAHSSAPKSKVKAIAVVCKNDKLDKEQTVTPCGACRQVINEFEDMQGSKIEIIIGLANGKNSTSFTSVKTLLPHSFDSSALIS